MCMCVQVQQLMAYALTDLDRNEEPFICSFHICDGSQQFHHTKEFRSKQASKRVQHKNRRQKNEQNGELLPYL